LLGRATIRHLSCSIVAVPYLLAVFAVIVPAVLVVQTIRGRVRLQCCAADPSRDLRMRGDEPVATASDGAQGA
jgi:hypothetical protein